jgi:hypothetical protein
VFLFPILDTLLHRLPRSERDDLLLSHINLLARSWIPGFAGSSLFDLEHAEVAQLRTSFLGDRVQHRVQCLLHYHLDEFLVDIYILGDGPDKVFLGHKGTPLSDAFAVRSAVLWVDTDYCIGRNRQWLPIGLPWGGP